MKNPPDFGCVELPEICKPCGDALLDQAKREIGSMYKITRYCPHRGTLVHAELGEIEGQQGIIRWGILGPVSEAEAIQQIKEMAARDNVEIEVLSDSARLH